MGTSVLEASSPPINLQTAFTQLGLDTQVYRLVSEIPSKSKLSDSSPNTRVIAVVFGQITAKGKLVAAGVG